MAGRHHVAGGPGCETAPLEPTLLMACPPHAGSGPRGRKGTIRRHRCPPGQRAAPVDPPRRVTNRCTPGPIRNRERIGRLRWTCRCGVGPDGPTGSAGRVTHMCVDTIEARDQRLPCIHGSLGCPASRGCRSRRSSASSSSEARGRSRSPKAVRNPDPACDQERRCSAATLASASPARHAAPACPARPASPSAKAGAAGPRLDAAHRSRRAGTPGVRGRRARGSARRPASAGR